MSAGVHVVPHTHWDREWYLPFQRFRLQLVGLVDRLLELMEADERYRFTLDGQLATLDDYLEVRPEAEERIRRLVEERRLAIGPWQVLMDEFLVSGETILRNLEYGQRRGAELGGAMSVGSTVGSISAHWRVRVVTVTLLSSQFCDFVDGTLVAVLRCV